MDDHDADYEPPPSLPSSPTKGKGASIRSPSRSPTPEDSDRHARLTQVVAQPIQRLEADVVNKIAAGEIIHRPANALKELIENSLDAGATLVRITLKDGGIKSLQIQDNGSGVRSEDLPMLCERFATSKLRDFSDLTKMTTFGFRGEALASISYVSAGMSVVSKTRDASCAYKAHYSQGRLVPPKPGQSSAPKPCAGTDGTLITAEDLFFNVPQRLQALRGPAEEYTRALEVATKYAVHYGGRGVGFICKKAGSNMTDLSLPSSETQTTLDTIRQVYGSSIARELVRLKPLRSGSLHFDVKGWISGANWSTKRTTFLCFINHRLVDCAPLKRALEAVYSALLPRGGHPWLYISLEIQPDKIDVNVHPTKREVRFLNEDEIIEAICEHAQSILAGANASRTFSFTQALLPGASVPDGNRPGPSSSQAPGAATRKRLAEDSSDGIGTSSGAEGSRTQRGSLKVDPRKLVRTDAKTRTLDSMQGFTQQRSATAVDRDPLDHAEDEGMSDEQVAQSLTGPAGTSRAALVATQGKGKIPESDCTLTSVREMRKAIVRGRHVGLTEILQSHTFVGVVDVNLGLSLLQNSTRLYLVRHLVLIREFAYQLAVRQFGSLARVKLSPSPSIGELVRLGVEMEDERERRGVDVDEVVKRVCKTLTDRADMLEEYFSIRLVPPPTSSTTDTQPHSSVDPEEWLLENMPALIPAQPALVLERLPTFALRLGMQVRWREEKGCFEDVCREIARAHVPLGSAAVGEDDEAVGGEDQEMADGESRQPGTTQPPRSARQTAADKSKWEVQHIWFPAMSSSRGAFLPPKSLLTEAPVGEDEQGAAVMQVANLPDLYRVFERC